MTVQHLYSQIKLMNDYVFLQHLIKIVFNQYLSFYIKVMIKYEIGENAKKLHFN